LEKSHATQENGLGLALVKRVIDIMVEEISVDSTPGKGSTYGKAERGMRMKRIKRVLLHLLHPGGIWTLILVLLAGGQLIYCFTTNSPNPLLAYGSYAFSAYALTILIVSFRDLMAGFRSITQKVKALVSRNKYGSLLLNDAQFRTKVSLYQGLFLNLIYAVFKLFSGILYSSFWFGAEAVYYIILCMVRFLLLREVRKGESDLKRELKEYRFCGCLLFALNAALTGVVYQMINHEKGTEYPGLLIYAAATFAFYCFTISVINVVKYRKYNSPVLSAAKMINLAKALVAMFSLQNAMFVSFGGDQTFERIMNSIFGGCVCLAIFIMAAFMVLRANRDLKKLNISQI